MTLRAVTASAAGIAVATLLVTLLVTGNSPMPRPEPTAAAAQGAMKSGESEAGGVPGPEKRRAMRILDNGCTYNPRGIPSCGTLLGAAYGSNSDPVRWERQMGHRLGVHRTYFDGSEVDEAVAQARTDLARQRIPWISFKLPHSWGAMAAGAGRRVGPGPVAPARTVARPRLGRASTTSPRATATSGTGRPCRPGWPRSCATPRPTSPSRSSSAAGTSSTARTSTACPRCGPHTAIDLVGFDVYNKYGVVKNGHRITSHTQFESHYFDKFERFARAHDVAWGLAETGHTDLSAGTDPLFLQRLYDAVSSNGGVAISYFNSTINSIAPWRLEGAKSADFAATLRETPTL